MTICLYEELSRIKFYFMAKKKNKNKGAQVMSPDKYITTKVGELPLGKTYISRKGAEAGVYVVLVTRVHSTGKITVGVYLIDMYCLGVKDSYYYLALDPDDLKECALFNRIDDFEEVDYAEAHNLIYGALAYAEEAGIEPCPEFKVSEYILEPDDDRIPLMDFEFGHNGVRELVIGPDRREMKYIPILNKNVPGQFIVTGYIDDHYAEADSVEDDEEYYNAVTGNDDPLSFNFDFHPFPHAPYPEDVEEVRHRELLDIFYPESIEEMPDITLDAAQIAVIRAIPREELLEDLRMMEAYEFGQAESELEEDGYYNDMESNVMYHICAILAETGGSDTKDLVTGIMRQSYHWHEAYLGDYGMELLHSVLANAFEECPEELASMVIEQGYSAHSRSVILYTLENIALWHPSVRQRIENELVRLAETILHGDGEKLPLLNDYVVGTLSGVMISLELRTALPLVKEMHERHLVDERVFGDYEDQLKELAAIENKTDRYIEPRFTNLEQIYKHYK